MAALLVAATLGVGILIGSVISDRAGASHATYENVKTLAVPDPVVMSNTFSGIVTKVGPAVVNISSTQLMQAPPRVQLRRTPITPQGPGSQVRPRGGSPQGDDPSMDDFFNKFFDGNPDQGDQDRAEKSLGSGIIVDSKGFILTNNHVVDQATRVQVQLEGDTTKYEAKVVGVDVETDLAVIKIEAPRALPYAKLGNSDGVQVGDWVLAIGSPFGLNATVTAGIVSAKDRDRSQLQTSSTQFQRFLQTDAAINPGNSGGPLVDMAGQVIGINTAIMTGSRSMGNEGVGFALPSNVAIDVYNQLVTHGHVTRGAIGITFREDESTNPIALHSLGAEYGIMIGSVDKDGPAAKAGLKAEDVITKINGKPVHIGNDLVDPVSRTPVGNKVEVTYVRDKVAHTTSVTVGDRSKISPEEAKNDEVAPTAPVKDAFGLHVANLTPEEAKEIGIDADRGVIVKRDPTPASFGEDLGFRHGNVILSVNGQPVSNVADYQKIISSLRPGQEVVFRVLEMGDTVMSRRLAGIVPPAN
nr:Do family serine endopeptidase [Candidatus Acidoferrales bacterium]